MKIVASKNYEREKNEKKNCVRFKKKKKLRRKKNPKNRE
jgi:hypothetical protein